MVRTSTSKGEERSEYSYGLNNRLISENVIENEELIKGINYTYKHAIKGTSSENLVKSRVSELVPFHFLC